MCFRERNESFGLFPLPKKSLVEITTDSLLTLSSLRIVPRDISAEPFPYPSAVSMKLIPNSSNLFKQFF